MNDAPKGPGAVVGEDGADLVLTGEISGPCVDPRAVSVVGGGVWGKSCSGNILDTGESKWKRVVVVVDRHDFEPAGEC